MSQYLNEEEIWKITAGEDSDFVECGNDFISLESKTSESVDVIPSNISNVVNAA